ncbi:MAG: extracellular solute-binding protein [Lachnospirales bacterium]
MLNKMKYVVPVIVGMSVVLTSCGGSSSVSEDTVTVWIPGDEVEYGFYFDMFENYKEHIESQGGEFDYVIEQQPWSDYWTKLPLEVNNGRGPDMYLAHDSYMDVLLPISKELDLGDEILDSLDVKGLYLGENGKDIFVPTVLLTYVMYANTDVVGDIEEIPETWGEFAELAKGYTDSNNGIIGFDYNFNILENLQYNDKVTFTTEAGDIEFYSTPYETLKKWQDEGVTDYFNYGNGSPEKTLNENAVAFIHSATWVEFWSEDEVKARMKAFPVPRLNEDGYYKAVGEPTFGISKNVSDEKFEVCNDIIKFMLTDEETVTNIVKSNSGVANNRNIVVEYEPYTAGDAVTKTFETGKTAFSVLPTGLEDVIKANLEGVLMGDDVNQVIENAYINLEGVKVERLKLMEDDFRDLFE